MYAERKVELELCVYCPKLCRPACPVSNAEPRESLIPWGKMSSAYYLARGDVSDLSYAHVAWACTGCHACTDFCHHKNPVANTLYDARRDAFAAGLAPPEAVRVANTFTAHDDQSIRAWTELRASHLPNAERVNSYAGAPALFIGCSALRRAPEEAVAIHRVAEAVLPLRAHTMPRCCGLPLLHAGDVVGFKAHARALGETLTGATEIVFADPGCHVALEHPDMRAALGGVPVTSLVQRAAENITRFKPGAVTGETPAPLRYHDACHLGRGLGLYEEPRALLARARGSAPLEFTHTRNKSVCSGGGGGLPWSMPDTSNRMAKTRIEEHVSLNRPESHVAIVTACPSSLIRFQKSGEQARGFYEVLAESL